MPENFADLAWWALNGCILLLLFFIRRELIRGTNLQEKNQRNTHQMFMFLIQMNARCNTFHPDKPQLLPPKWEE
jgi:hypothetical protein